MWELRNCPEGSAALMRRWLPWVIVVVVVAIAIPLAWKLSARWSAGDGNDPVPVAGADLSGSGPGTLVSAMTMPGFSRSREGQLVEAARVVYRSTSGDTGQATQVSGSVFTPKGTAPAGGWPVVAFGHGTTGIDEPCAPSLSDSLLGFSTVVVGYVNLGYAVALPDYQGLGAPGVHPYTDARTAGLNMIDSVRALRHAFGDASTRWAAVGGSQGGGAAWAADERAASYGPELDLVGAVAYVPAANVTGIVDEAVANTMNNDQALAFQSIVESLARLHPEAEPRRLPSWRRGEVLGPVVRLFGPAGLRSCRRGSCGEARGLHARQLRGGRPVARPAVGVGVAPTAAVGAVVRHVLRTRHLHRPAVDHGRDRTGVCARRHGGLATPARQGARRRRRVDSIRLAGRQIRGQTSSQRLSPERWRLVFGELDTSAGHPERCDVVGPGRTPCRRRPIR